MKWRIPEPPKIGDHRSRQRFAWWPVETSDGWRVWFEEYQDVEEYQMIEYYDPEPYGGSYRRKEWVRIKRYAT